MKTLQALRRLNDGERPLGGADQLVHRQIMQEIEVLEAQGASDLVTQLRRGLRRLRR